METPRNVLEALLLHRRVNFVKLLGAPGCLALGGVSKSLRTLLKTTLPKLKIQVVNVHISKKKLYRFQRVDVRNDYCFELRLVVDSAEELKLALQGLAESPLGQLRLDQRTHWAFHIHDFDAVMMRELYQFASPLKIGALHAINAETLNYEMKRELGWLVSLVPEDAIGYVCIKSEEPLKNLKAVLRGGRRRRSHAQAFRKVMVQPYGGDTEDLDDLTIGQLQLELNNPIAFINAAHRVARGGFSKIASLTFNATFVSHSSAIMIINAVRADFPELFAKINPRAMRSIYNIVACQSTDRDFHCCADIMRKNEQGVEKKREIRFVAIPYEDLGFAVTMLVRELS